MLLSVKNREFKYNIDFPKPGFYSLNLFHHKTCEPTFFYFHVFIKSAHILKLYVHITKTYMIFCLYGIQHYSILYIATNKKSKHKNLLNKFELM
jgi:hypothetical protein